jgi:hypothetical protein
MKNKFINKIEDIFLYKRRREKYVREMNIKIHKYLNETDDEFLLDYVDINSRYKHNKFILFIYSLTTLLIIKDSWNYFYRFLYRLLTSNDPTITDMVDVAMILSMIIMLSIIFVIALIFFDMIRTVYKLNREQIILNEVKKMRKEK